ncbi:unnamed protein product [Linum tenue]|uniref:Uncharacterized protein n=1 Tax=Linum tenue TaxID=586396 RepID=A0AAV0N8F7_9ROSI|nr:unnamed protein product [Linum tenue]CAI0456638.1 unnamed protein product [Linum tenue]
MVVEGRTRTVKLVRGSTHSIPWRRYIR